MLSDEIVPLNGDHLNLAIQLDLVHYSVLIWEIKEKEGNAQRSHLFLSELEKIFGKYIVK